jgi:hypothetical protein
MIKYIDKEADFTECRTACYYVAFELSDYELIRKLKWIKYNCRLQSVAFIRNFECQLLTIYLLQNSDDSQLIKNWAKKAFNEDPEFLTRTRQKSLDKELNS